MTLARSWPVFLVALALYVATCSTTVQGGDAGEWMTVAAIGGVGHPPGYPLWTLLLRALALVPIGTIAFRASLGSALLAALAVALVHRAVWRVTLDGRAAWLAALALMVSATFWRYATVAEVFAGAAATGHDLGRARLALPEPSRAVAARPPRGRSRWTSWRPRGCAR